MEVYGGLQRYFGVKGKVLEIVKDYWRDVAIGVGILSLAISSTLGSDNRVTPSDFLPITGKDNGSALTDDSFLNDSKQAFVLPFSKGGIFPFNPKEAHAQEPDGFVDDQVVVKWEQPGVSVQHQLAINAVEELGGQIVGQEDPVAQELAKIGWSVIFLPKKTQKRQ